MSHSLPSIPASSPFQPEQLSTLNQVIPQLGRDQIIWLEGFLSGIRNQANQAAQEAVVTKPLELTILFGSESGNAEGLADSMAQATKSAGWTSRVLSMGDIDAQRLQGVDNLLVLVSTWGEGDPPENALDFYDQFMGADAPKLEGTRFSVLSLGDSSYEHFCKMGKDFDRRLEELGGQRLVTRVDCDVDFDSDFESWKQSVIKEFELLSQTSAPSSVLNSAAPVVKEAYSRKNPFPSLLKERVLLNGAGSHKETIHLEFDLAGSGLDYTVGDALAVIPHNADSMVTAILDQTKLAPNSQVQIKNEKLSLGDALKKRLDITALSVPVIKRYAELANSEALNTRLMPENKKALLEYIAGREIIDLLIDYPVKQLQANDLVSTMRKLPPRLYSIASSLQAHPNEVHLTVGVVRYNSHGRDRKGVCSSFLADDLPVGQTVDVFVSPNKHFKLPDDPNTPLIMVGPGTGIAPFRAFIEERAATGAKGKNWLFFGDQHYLTDFLYQTEWQGYLKQGLLSKLDAAFSRDQSEKVYVQDRMLANSQELYQWLEEGAYFCVCGDASRMAADVDRALHQVIETAGKKSAEQAADYVKQMKADKRYLKDVY
tara:strand:- start:47 stop:1846 length:1800 start_codon:yes stop_codon:yes gene_type:complete